MLALVFVMPLWNPESFQLSILEHIQANQGVVLSDNSPFNSRKHYDISKKCPPGKMVKLLQIEDELLRFMKAAELQVKYGRYEA